MVELSVELGKHWSQIRLSRRNKNSHIGHIEFEATVRHQSISLSSGPLLKSDWKLRGEVQGGQA